jgi:non-heme chloroperoxidase
MPRSASLPPFQQRYLQTPDVRLHYAEVEGPGRPMVMLHGIGMDWRVWQAISRRLAPSFHLYLLDLRGHGQSEKPPHGYSLAHYAVDVEEFLDALRLRNAVLVGSSLGGMVVACAELPVDIVSQRILVDPPITGGPVRDASMFEDILRLKHRPVEELGDYLAALNPGASQFLMTMMSEMWHEAADGVIEDMLAQREQYFDIDAALAGSDSPTLLMAADPDLGASLRPDQARRAARLLRHGELVTVRGAGHAIHATRPREFADLVHSFAGAPEAALEPPSSSPTESTSA